MTISLTRVCSSASRFCAARLSEASSNSSSLRASFSVRSRLSCWRLFSLVRSWRARASARAA
jgi:hypothetical protein